MFERFFLRLIVRNVPAIIRFFDSLEAHLDTFVKKAQAELDSIDNQIAALNEQRAKKAGDINVAITIKGKLPRNG